MFNKQTYLHHQNPTDHSGASTSMVNEILLHDMLSGHYPITDPTALFNLGHGPNGSDPSSMAHLCPKTAKRDRHSKINTSKGPRDRRVRLSIGVARKFFDLQEMLGFDKPSKTLDWLLIKSKSAIKHLVNSKQQQQQQQPGCSLSECEEINNNNNIENNEINKSLRKKGKSKKAYKDVHQQVAKESRVKARARARERTKEKMCIKQQMCINEYDQMGPGPGLIQYMNNQLEVCRISASGYNNSNNGMENWDSTNFDSQSGLCAILDQHKFNINSSSNN